MSKTVNTTPHSIFTIKSKDYEKIIVTYIAKYVKIHNRETKLVKLEVYSLKHAKS